MLSHRDVSAMLGLNRNTSMWELWHINKGSIQRSYEASARSFWSGSLRPHVLAGLQKRYECKLAPFESRMAFGVVKATAAKILEPGKLPILGATHIVVDMISTEGYANTYLRAEDEYLPTDKVHASVVHNAFGTDRVAFFLFIGNGEREEFLTLDRDPKIDGAVQETVTTFLGFVQRDEEPEPDYELDAQALMFMNVDTKTYKPPLRIDDNPELRRKVLRLKELKAEKSTLGSTERQLDKERRALEGLLADEMRGHEYATLGNQIIQFSRRSRTTTARVDEWVQVNFK
ncbi:MAG: hypothetical protein DI537_05550 [Stutzerimonas stutzeri]|nr:MAG: hypothetical protein DI537_05550 [Stutzerimonas stutzeri]